MPITYQAMTNAERQRRFRERHPDYYARLQRARRAAAREAAAAILARRHLEGECVPLTPEVRAAIEALRSQRNASTPAPASAAPATPAASATGASPAAAPPGPEAIASPAPLPASKAA